MAKNRIKVGLPLYGTVSGNFVKHFFAFISQIAAYDKYAGFILTERPYVDVAMNEIVATALQSDDWDYLFSIEQDNTMPPGILERIGSLDPATHPIVGFLYFGKVAEDQRPIPGHMIDHRLKRLDYDEVCKMLPQRGGTAGFHRVDTVGMGATAIHRSVLENWPWTPRHPWFRTDYDDFGVLGHDLWFCIEAAKLGYPIFTDSSSIPGHLGEWKSTADTYLNTYEASHRRESERGRVQPGVVIPWVADGLRGDTLDAVAASGLPHQLVEMLGDSAYHDLIADLWHDGETFLTVEQDITPHPGALQELANCPEEWCAFAYDYPPFGQYAGMGCAKFSSALIKRFPDALSATATWYDEKHPPKHWCRVDGWLKQYLLQHGARQHVHGLVAHHHKGRPAHDCV